MEKEDESDQFTLLLVVVVEVPAKYCSRTYLPTYLFSTLLAKVASRVEGKVL